MQIILPRPDTRHEVTALRAGGPSGRTLGFARLTGGVKLRVEG